MQKQYSEYNCSYINYVILVFKMLLKMHKNNKKKKKWNFMCVNINMNGREEMQVLSNVIVCMAPYLKR